MLPLLRAQTANATGGLRVHPCTLRRIDLCLHIDYMDIVGFKEMLNKFDYGVSDEDLYGVTLNDKVAPADLQGDILLGLPLEEILAIYTSRVSNCVSITSSTHQ